MRAGHWLRLGAGCGALAAMLLTLGIARDSNAQGRSLRRASMTSLRDTFRDRVHTDIVVTRDLAYRTAVDAAGRAETLRLDVYEPLDEFATTKRPVVIWLHSGGFVAGDKSELARYANDFAERGYVSVAINFRQRPHMQWFDLNQRAQAVRDADEDAIAAVGWIRLHARELHADGQLIFAAGYSGGAIIAFDLADPPRGEPNAGVAGAISIAGYGIGAGQPGSAPVIDFHGEKDTMVPYALGANSCKADQAIGVQCRLITFTGDGHEIGNTRTATISQEGANFFAAIIGSRPSAAVRCC